MIQVYKKNELFIIENTVTDIIYPNLTREEALVLLKKFDRNDPEHRCDFAIKEDNICFEYVSLDDKDKIISDLEAKLAEKQSKIQELNDMYEDLLVAKGTENELKQAQEDVEMLDERNLCLFSLLYETLEKQGCENITSTIEQMTNLHLNKCSHWYKNNRVCDELEQQLAEKENTITNLIEDSNASKELLKKQLNEQAGLCEEFRFQLEEKDNEIEKLNEELDDKNFCKNFVDLYSENKLKTQMLHKNWKDKISFAVEQLDKVKEYVMKSVEEFSCVYEEDMLDEIDNQIEELKKEMK